MSDQNEPTQSGALPSVPLQPVVRLVPIDFMNIYRQTGMKRGKIGFSPAFGWCAYRHSPEDGLADCAMFTPPSMEPGETELRIVNGTHWEFSKPNPSRQVPAAERTV